ncbi:MAG: hypothetical protein PHT59_06840 [Candidatus Omnitrophica bacterium]|nr:hypothetical protein [Candidatus Omnitrophota bacterium]
MRKYMAAAAAILLLCFGSGCALINTAIAAGVAYGISKALD